MAYTHDFGYLRLPSYFDVRDVCRLGIYAVEIS